MNRDSRLKMLEQRVEHHQDGAVTVTLADGTRRRLPLPDVIPLLQLGQVLSVDGTGGPGQGHLLDIIRDLI